MRKGLRKSGPYLWVVGSAVRCEPVSIANSLLTAKITAHFSNLATLSDSSCAKTRALQQLQCRFPTQNNRENNYGISAQSRARQIANRRTENRFCNFN